MFKFEHRNSPMKESERYETPGLRRYGRIEHITLQSTYFNPDCIAKGGGFLDTGNKQDCAIPRP